MSLSFLELLNDVLVNNNTEREEYYKGYEYRHNPSSSSFKYSDGRVIGSCLRSLYYKATKQPKTRHTDLTGMLQMGFGDAIHTWLLSKLSKSKLITLTAEAGGKLAMDPLTKEVSYRLDGLVSHDGTQGWLEIKTQQSFAVQRMMKEGKSPKENHLPQGICYFGTNPALTWGHFLYVGRDNGLRCEYRLDRQGDRYTCTPILPAGPTFSLGELSFEGIKQRWTELEAHLKSKTVPKRDFKVVFNDDGKIVEKRVKRGVDYKTDYTCAYCDWQEYCWAQEGAKEDAYKIQ